MFTWLSVCILVFQLQFKNSGTGCPEYKYNYRPAPVGSRKNSSPSLLLLHLVVVIIIIIIVIITRHEISVTIARASKVMVLFCVLQVLRSSVCRDSSFVVFVRLSSNIRG